MGINGASWQVISPNDPTFHVFLAIIKRCVAGVVSVSCKYSILILRTVGLSYCEAHSVQVIPTVSLAVITTQAVPFSGSNMLADIHHEVLSPCEQIESILCVTDA